MKKIFVIGLFALLAMQACKKEDKLIDGEKPEERIAKGLEKYQKELTGSANGWKAYLYTTELGGGYGFYMSFKDNSRVDMLADFDTESSSDLFESTFQIKQVMAPTLLFDTYSYLHLLADPNPNEFGGTEGVGFGSDFEFEFREQVGDTIKLLGKKRQTPLILVKATAAEKAFYTDGGFSDLITDLNNYLALNPFQYILDPSDNTKKVQVDLKTGVSARVFSLSLLTGTSINNVQVPFAFSNNGFVFKNPLKYGGLSFVSIEWNKDADKLFLITTTGAKVELLKSASAIIPLHITMGLTAKGLAVPGRTTLPGSSTSFVTAYNKMHSDIVNRFSVPTIGRDFGMSFNAANETFTVYLNVVQEETNVFAATYTYNYTKTENGEYKFIGPPKVEGGAGSAILGIMNTFILSQLAAQTFTLDYYNDAANKRVLGKMTSKESPTFFLTGVIN